MWSGDTGRKTPSPPGGEGTYFAFATGFGALGCPGAKRSPKLVPSYQRGASAPSAISRAIR